MLDPNGQGPLVSPINTEEGDSGSGIFDSQNYLIGVLAGSRTASTGQLMDIYTGIWFVRDWIRTTLASEVVFPPDSLLSIPNSTGATMPSVAEGPDGGIHIASALSDGTVGHWEIAYGVAVKVGVVPGVTTNATDSVGLAMEGSGNPPMLGLAYREKTTKILKYVRWSASTRTWSSPVTRAGSVLSTGPAMAKGGVIAFAQTNGLPYTTSYDAATNTLAGVARPPVTSPHVDPAKRISVAYDPAYGGITVLGYRSTNGDWIQANGNVGCQSYFCPTDPPFPNSWASAMLAYNTGERVSIVTTQNNLTNNRVTYNASNYQWAASGIYAQGQLGVAQIGTNLAVVTYDQYLRCILYWRADNVFGNSF